MVAADQSQVVDWPLALATGRRWRPRGPQVSAAQARYAVAQLRELAVQAQGPVADYTGLVAPTGPGAALVVDRDGWLTRNVAGLATVLDPLLRRERSGGFGGALAARGFALELGGALAYLSGKVLGQYEVFVAQPPGRLLLVAPNIVAAEQALGVVPRDFRLWVCLHEQTHRVQFTGVPWLAGYLSEQVSQLLGPAVQAESDRHRSGGRIDWAGLGAAVRAALTRPTSAAQLASAAQPTDAAQPTSAPSLLEALQPPHQRDAFDRLTALLSLLEGHADVVMDEVGPRVVPTVTVIRERFSARRASPTRLDAVLRNLVGLDAKLAQYAQGAAFVRGVQDRVGPAGFAQVWADPANLPLRTELAHPDRWCARVLGR